MQWPVEGLFFAPWFSLIMITKTFWINGNCVPTLPIDFFTDWCEPLNPGIPLTLCCSTVHMTLQQGNFSWSNINNGHLLYSNYFIIWREFDLLVSWCISWNVDPFVDCKLEWACVSLIIISKLFTVATADCINTNWSNIVSFGMRDLQFVTVTATWSCSLCFI